MEETFDEPGIKAELRLSVMHKEEIAAEASRIEVGERAADVDGRITDDPMIGMRQGP